MIFTVFQLLTYLFAFSPLPTAHSQTQSPAWVDSFLKNVSYQVDERSVPRAALDSLKSATVIIRQRPTDGGVSGSGYFIADDFPILHTAAHVAQPIGDVAYFFVPDGRGGMKGLLVTGLDQKFRYGGHDSATLDLSEYQNDLKGVVPLKRAEKRLDYFDPGFAAGYPNPFYFKKNKLKKIAARITKEQAIRVAPLVSDFCFDHALIRGAYYKLSESEKKESADKIFELSFVDRRGLNGELPYLEGYWVDPNRMNLAEASLEFATSRHPEVFKGKVKFDLYHNLCGRGTAIEGMSGGPVVNSQLEVVGTLSQGNENKEILIYFDLF